MLSGYPVKYLVAAALFLAGLLLLACGANVCWIRWARRGGKKTVKELQEEDKLSRRKTQNPPSAADKR